MFQRGRRTSAGGRPRSAFERARRQRGRLHIDGADNIRKARVLGWPPNAVFASTCGAAILCCIPMAMLQGLVVVFCSDLGITRSMGTPMLSILLGTAFLSRQVWA